MEAIGGLATGALVASQFEREEARVEGAHAACLNCGATVRGKYCASCGQPTHLHRSMAHVAEEFLHGLWHIDSKAWRTLPMLFFRPGQLTRDYVRGRRARYIAPVTLFLLTIFLMFFVFGLSSGSSVNLDGMLETPAATREGRLAQARAAEADAAKAEQAVVAARRDLEQRSADEKAAPGAEGVAAGAMAALEAARDVAVARAKRARAAVDDPAAAGSENPGEPAWARAVRQSVERGDLKVNVGVPGLNEKGRHALLNPELTLYKIQQKGYKLSFLLVPMSLPWLWLMFLWKRDVRAYDHVIFLLYSISFISLLLILVVLLFQVGVPPEWLVPLLLLGFPVHLFVQLKGAYALGVFSALWRTAALLTLAVMTLSIYFSLILALGLID
ncbi:DUF3667 domain-containing protein [Sandaracinobacteroides saxicola]|uniref:DUF3667 domain-containing protein n=1 Tax=Sandaracinobacteroides saxicola TaxID=2759707 RepID=A0A7G5IEG0_9SPHN|nr:DUF3667 domain-containing protein [Sandaracinobacteroides saxicola]QMW21752.1 DUF3667 domain-containing protein [Sandaracinobacteroides saxicola]